MQDIHRDRVLTEETAQTSSAVLDGELSTVLYIRTRLLGVISMVEP